MDAKGELKPVRCPNGCRPTKPMRWVDSWFCPSCKDEWASDGDYDPPKAPAIGSNGAAQDAPPTDSGEGTEHG